jgi:hypothetical protein
MPPSRKACKAGQKCENGACVQINRCEEKLDGGIYIDEKFVQKDSCNPPIRGFFGLSLTRKDYLCTPKNQPKFKKIRTCAADEKCDETNGQCVKVKCEKKNGEIHLNYTNFLGDSVDLVVQRDRCNIDAFSYSCNRNNSKPVLSVDGCDDNKGIYEICQLDPTSGNAECKAECSQGQTKDNWKFARRTSDGYTLYDNCTQDYSNIEIAECEKSTPKYVEKTCTKSSGTDRCYLPRSGDDLSFEEPYCRTTCATGESPNKVKYVEMIIAPYTRIYDTCGSKVATGCTNFFEDIQRVECYNGLPRNKTSTNNCPDCTGQYSKGVCSNGRCVCLDPRSCVMSP